MFLCLFSGTVLFNTLITLAKSPNHSEKSSKGYRFSDLFYHLVRSSFYLTYIIFIFQILARPLCLKADLPFTGSPGKFKLVQFSLFEGIRTKKGMMVPTSTRRQAHTHIRSKSRLERFPCFSRPPGMGHCCLTLLLSCLALSRGAFPKRDEWNVYFHSDHIKQIT